MIGGLLRLMPSLPGSGTRPRLDAVGALLVTAATGTLTYALIDAGHRGWGSGRTLGLVALGLLLHGVLAGVAPHRPAALVSTHACSLGDR